MKIYLKPIQISILKEEIVIEIEQGVKVSELVEEIIKLKPEISSSLDFMFRGKKLSPDKSLQDQGVKEGSKLMMYQSDQGKSSSSPTKEQISNLNKQNAKNSLITMGFKSDMVESVVKTIPNVDSLSSELIIEKSLVFLKSLSKATLSEYSVELEEKTSQFDIEEDKITSIFAVGDGIQGQLGIGKYIKTDFPMRVNKLRNLKIKTIACGVYHTTALTENGHVYFWGRYYMPLKVDDFTNKTDFKTGDFPYPVLMNSLTNELIVEIGCGSNHSLAINDKGEIFTWGEGLYGQLGHKYLNNEFYPRKIESLQNFRFKNVKGGATHSIAITHDDFVFGWGSNEKNQLNLKNLKNAKSPLILPLYELTGNFTIDEIKNLNLDEQFNNVSNSNIMGKPNFLSDVDDIAIKSEIDNDFSFNVDDLMKIKLIDCGTWFTVCTSQMFPNTVYLFGNFYKKVIKITYFEQNKLEIKQISASNYHICVLTGDNSVYKININNLQNGEEIERIDVPENIEIEKIGCGYNYLLFLTKNKQGILNQNFAKDNYTFLNSDIKSNFNDISFGPFHFFITTSLNNLSLGNYLYDKINNYTNTLSLDDIFPDLYIKSKSNLEETQNDFMFPCHTFFIGQFIKTDLMEMTENKVMSIPLSNEKILILLELIYTANLKILFTEESKKILENPDILQNLHFNLQEILKFLKVNATCNENSDTLIHLINLYAEKIREILSYERVSVEYERVLMNKKLSDSLNFILNNIMETKIKHNLNEIANVRRADNNEDEDEDEEEFINNNNRNVNKNYFEKFENKGTKVLNSSGLNSTEYDQTRFNLNDYLQTQNKLIDYRYQFNQKIMETKESINSLVQRYIRNNNRDELSIKIKLPGAKECIKINKLILSFKSLYFKHFIQTSKENSESIFDFDKIKINFNSQCVVNTFKFLNSENFKLNSEDLFEMLDLASYFMIDNLSSLVEIELEGIINLENVLCLLEVSRDYSLTFLRRSCLFYLMLNLNEAKNKSIFKFIKDEDMTELKRLMALNNKSDK